MTMHRELLLMVHAVGNFRSPATYQDLRRQTAAELFCGDCLAARFRDCENDPLA